MPRTRILVVEDEAIVGLALAEELREGGHDVMGPYATVDETISAISSHRPDAALLDMNLGAGQTSQPIAEWLDKSNVPFALLSGYDEIDPTIEAYRNRPYLSKPISPERAVTETARLLASASRELPQ